MTATYEQRVLLWLQQELAAFPPAGPGGKGILVEDVRLEQGGTEGQDIVILFREAGHLHCLFGFRNYLQFYGCITVSGGFYCLPMDATTTRRVLAASSPERLLAGARSAGSSLPHGVTSR